MKRTLIVLSLAALAGSALGAAAFFKIFAASYKAPAGSALSKAMCRVCHTTLKGKELNPYGTDVQKALRAAGAKVISPNVLKQVEALDSDDDGAKNVDELKKGTLPGDAKSK